MLFIVAANLEESFKEDGFSDMSYGKGKENAARRCFQRCAFSNRQKKTPPEKAAFLLGRMICWV